MKTLATLTGLLYGTTAFAAAHPPEASDGIFVWIFLGFFVMILIGQIMPAVLLVIGMIKGLFAKTEKKAAVEAR